MDGSISCTDSAEKSPLRGALKIWHDLADLTRLLFAEPSPAPVKYWLYRQGLIDSPEVRLPLTAVSPALAERIDRAMAHWNGEGRAA